MADEEMTEIIAKLNSRHNIEKLDGLKTVLRVREHHKEIAESLMRRLLFVFWFRTMGWQRESSSSPHLRFCFAFAQWVSFGKNMAELLPQVSKCVVSTNLEVC